MLPVTTIAPAGGGGTAASGRFGAGHRLRERQVAFGNAEEMDRLHGRDRLLQSARIGQAYIFTGDADQAARDTGRT